MININKEEVGNRLRQLRTDAGITQNYLANELHYSIPYISNLENGKKCVTLSVLLDFANMYNVSVDYILFGRKEYTDVFYSVLYGLSSKEIELVLAVISAIVPIITSK